jgi:hypothetical protein
MSSRSFITVASFAAMLTAGCNSSSPTAPPPNPADQFAGVWSGPINDEAAGTGMLKFVLEAFPAGTVRGTWAATFSNPANDNAGTVSSTVALSPLAFLGRCPDNGPPGSGIIFTMALSGTRMNGNYSTINCAGLRRGTADLAKQ